MKKIIILFLLFALTGCGRQVYLDADNELVQKEIILAGERVEIGNFSLGAGNTKFVPEVKLNKWGDEASIRIWSEEEGDDKAIEKDGKVIWKTKDNKKEYNFYPVQLGNGVEGYEYEVILNKKPTSNVINLKIDSTGLDFFYQPSLAEQQKIGAPDLQGLTCSNLVCVDDSGKNRVIMEEWAVNSYFVSNKIKSRRFFIPEEEEKYGNGQAFILRRPQMIDSVGTKVWGELNIQGNNLSVTIPQDFLDKAVYPIKHATGLTIGYTSWGGTATDIGDRIYASAGTASSSGTASKVNANLRYSQDGGPLTTGWKAWIALYADSDDSLVTNSNIERTSGFGSSMSDEEFTFSTSPTITSGAVYAVAVSGNRQYNKGSYDVMQLGRKWYVGSSDKQVRIDSLDTYDGTAPNPVSWTTDTNTNDITYDIYVTYTASAPASTYCGHTGGDWYISTDCWISNSTTTQGNLYITETGSLNCTDNAVISVHNMYGKAGTKINGKNGCQITLDNHN